MNFKELKKHIESKDEEPTTWLELLAAAITLPIAFGFGVGFCLLDAWILQKMAAVFFPAYAVTYLQCFGTVFIISLLVETPQKHFETKKETLAYFLARLFLRPAMYIGGAYFVAWMVG